MAERPPAISVLAGTNGAGKSSILGEFIRRQGGDYYNPDEAAHVLRIADPTLQSTEANGLAWKFGVDGLAAAVAARKDYVFETTLGGATVATMLAAAAQKGCRVSVWYVGLDSVDEHVRRVKARVRSGGHDIPDAKIRERYVRSVENLVLLLPYLYELKLFDNSITVRMAAGEAPRIRALFHLKAGRVLEVAAADTMPDWAKPVVAAATGAE